MFTIPKPNVIECDEGFSVRVLGRTGLEYREGTKSLRINSEVLAGPSGLGIYRNSIKAWDAPFEIESIDNAKRDEIVSNIRRAFQYQGFDIEVL